jgi:hypothetical protein
MGTSEQVGSRLGDAAQKQHRRAAETVQSNQPMILPRGFSGNTEFAFTSRTSLRRFSIAMRINH